MKQHFELFSDNEGIPSTSTSHVAENDCNVSTLIRPKRKKQRMTTSKSYDDNSLLSAISPHAEPSAAIRSSVRSLSRKWPRNRKWDRCQKCHSTSVTSDGSNSSKTSTASQTDSSSTVAGIGRAEMVEKMEMELDALKTIDNRQKMIM